MGLPDLPTHPSPLIQLQVSLKFVSLLGSLIAFYKVTSSDCQEGQSYSRKDYGQVPERTSLGRVFHPVASDGRSCQC